MYVDVWETSVVRVILILNIAHLIPTNITQDLVYTYYDMVG